MKLNAANASACADTLLHRLRADNLDFILNGDPLNRLPGHLSLSFKNCNAETLLHRLDLKNICVSAGSACNSRQVQVSHVLKALNIPNDYIRGTIRITFGKENSPADAETIANCLSKIIALNPRN